MKMPSFSLRTMLGLIAVVGVAFAVLLASSAWTALFATALAVLFGSAILGAIFRRGKSQAFCVGFILFAFTYILALRNECVHLLATNSVIHLIRREDRKSDWAVKVGEYNHYMTPVFHGHLLGCAAIGVLGGFIARAMYRTHDQ